MIFCAPVTADGQIGPRWCHAASVAVGEVADGVISRWDVHEVGWDATHDTESKGAHHARIVAFLREQQVDLVVAGGVGNGMVQVLAKMGVRVADGASGDARAAVAAAKAPEPVADDPAVAAGAGQRAVLRML